jgi:hypothetical protein
MPAEIEITFAPVINRAMTGTTMPALSGKGSASETRSTAGGQSTAAAQENDFVRICNSGDQALYVDVGQSPDASSAPRWFLPVGGELHLGCEAGDKVAFVSK